MLKNLHAGYQVATVLIICMLYIIAFTLTGYKLTTNLFHIKHQHYLTQQECFCALQHQHSREHIWSIIFRILFFIIPITLTTLFGCIAAISSLLILGLFRFSFYLID